jgi:hypothetical protein
MDEVCGGETPNHASRKVHLGTRILLGVEVGPSCSVEGVQRDEDVPRGEVCQMDEVCDDAIGSPPLASRMVHQGSQIDLGAEGSLMVVAADSQMERD